MSSEPPNTFHRHHQQSPQRHHLPPLVHGSNINIATSSTTNTPTSPVIYREYRKGNWTLEETLVLITAKRLDDQRRSKSTNVDPTVPRHTGELRWKWVENFCWNNGCLRSQNQCNDKWDNLLRDYKKVREYETKISQSANLPSYWAMDKQQRKDHNLPSNLTHQIYQELQDVVQKKSPLKILPPTTPQPPMPTMHQPPPPPPGPPPPTSTVAPAPVVSDTEASVSSEAEWGSNLDPDTKRKRVRDIGSSIVHGASSLARALKRCEEKKEKRHRELMELEEQRIRLDEAQNEAQREGVASLVAAVNNLSGAIQSLASDQRPAS